MFWLIETQSQIEYLINRQYKEVFIEIVPHHDKVHPALNDVSLVYFRPSIETKGFMLCIDHSETLSINKTLVNTLLQGIEQLWVRDKKNALYYFQIKSLLDINILTNPYIPEQTPTHTYFYNKYPDNKEINKIIPVVKHYEVCENNFHTLSPYFSSPVNSFYNDKLTVVFNLIEKNGIKIDRKIFDEYFPQSHSDRIYTRYNLSTLTTRPSNSFNGINFATLKKDNGERQSFIPQNDFFIEIDISAYHPTLLANILNYDLPKEDFHQHFADMYGVDYNTSKEITFRQIYGGVQDEYKHIDFFQKIDQYVKELWNTFQSISSITCPISGHVFEKDKLENMYSQKLLNYHNQNLETAQNVLILWDILKILKGKNTKLVLYVYDSFLLDVDKNEKDTFKQITQVFQKYKLQIKYKKGINYNFH